MKDERKRNIDRAQEHQLQQDRLQRTDEQGMLPWGSFRAQMISTLMGKAKTGVATEAAGRGATR